MAQPTGLPPILTRAQRRAAEEIRRRNLKLQPPLEPEVEAEEPLLAAPPETPPPATPVDEPFEIAGPGRLPTPPTGPTPQTPFMATGPALRGDPDEALQRQQRAQERRREDYLRSGEIIASLYPEYASTDEVRGTPDYTRRTLSLMQMGVERDPDAFLQDLFEKGRNPDTDFVLDLFQWTDEQKDTFWAGAPEGMSTALVAALARIFPIDDVDAVARWMLSSDEKSREEFWLEARENGSTEDVMALLRLTAPDATEEQLQGFFERGTEPAPSTLNRVLGAITTGEHLISGWWKGGIMVGGMAFHEFLDLFADGSTHSNEAGRIIDQAAQKHGPLWVFHPEVHQAWDVYFQERGMGDSPLLKHMAEFANPIYFAPIGNGIRLVAKPILKVPVLNAGAQSVARGFQAIKTPVVVPLQSAKEAAAGFAMKAPGAPAIVGGVDASKRFLLWELPSSAEMQSMLFKNDAFRGVAGKVPGFNRIAPGATIKEMPATIVTTPEITAASWNLELERRATKTIAMNDRNIQLGIMATIGDPIKMYGIKDGVASTAMVKPRVEGASMVMGDIMEAPERYIFTHPRGLEYAKAAQLAMREMKERAVREGVEVNELLLEDGVEYFHRVATGREITLRDGTKELEIFGRQRKGSLKERTKETMLEKMDSGVVYNGDPRQAISDYYDDMWAAIIDKRFKDNLDDMVGRIEGMAPTTPLERMNFKHPGVEPVWIGIQKEMDGIRKTVDAVRRASRGEVLPGATMAAIERRSPEIAARLNRILEVGERTFDQELSKFTAEVWTELKIDRQGFKNLIGELRGQPITAQHPVRASQIDDALKSLSADNRLSLSMLRQIYRNTLDFRKTELRALSLELNGKAKELLPKWHDAKNIRAEAMAEASKPGKFEDYIRMSSGEVHPMFRGQIYPQDVAEAVSARLDAEIKGFIGLGLAGSAKVSGVFVVMEAALDVSVMAIQGAIAHLAHPVLASRATTQMFHALIRPDEFKRYMGRNAGSMSERSFQLGSNAPVEFFESVGWLGQAAGKLPGPPGRSLKWAVGQTYGRAQAAYSMWATVFKDLMWKQNSVGWIARGEGHQYARMLDRMTGTMSFAAVGTPANLTNLMRGWIAFAPQYKGALISYALDALKAGPVGNQVRRDIGVAVAAAHVAYIGFTQALGKPAYLDPFRDGKKYMAIEHNGHWYGLGGGVVSLLRWQTDILASIFSVGENEPADLLQWNIFDDTSDAKWKNPFLKGALGQASPLTGMAVEATTGREYLGYPLESFTDWAKWAAENVTPIMLQDVLYDKSGVRPSPLFILGNAVGLRASPQSRWERLDDELKETPLNSNDTAAEPRMVWEAVSDISPEQRERIAGGETVLSVLDRHQRLVQLPQVLATAAPEILELRKDAIEDSLLRAGRDYKDYIHATKTQKDLTQAKVAKAWKEIVKEEKLGVREFRLRLKVIMAEHAGAMEAIRANPQFTDLFDTWDEARTKGEVDAEVFDLAVNDWWVRIGGTEFELPGGGFDFKARAAAEKDFVEGIPPSPTDPTGVPGYGQDVLDKIHELNQVAKDPYLEPAQRWLVEIQEAFQASGYWKLPSKKPKSFSRQDVLDGNVPENLLDLVNKYHDLEGNEVAQKALVEANPDLDRDFRREFRLANPTDDAMAAWAGYVGDVVTMEAYNILKGWTEEHDADLEELALDMPGEEFLEAHFEDARLRSEKGSGSIHVILHRLENPEYQANRFERNKDLTDDYSDRSVDALRLKVAFEDDYDAFDLLDTKDKQDIYLVQNKDFRDARFRVKIYEDGKKSNQLVDAALADLYAEYRIQAPDSEEDVPFQEGEGRPEGSSNSAEAKLFKWQNPRLQAFGEANIEWSWNPLDEREVPIWKIDVQWRVETERYDNGIPAEAAANKNLKTVGAREDAVAKARADMLASNDEFRRSRQTKIFLRQAINSSDREELKAGEVSSWITANKYLDKHVAFKDLPEKGHWQERFNRDNPGFYNDVFLNPKLMPTNSDGKPHEKLPDIIWPERHDVLNEKWEEARAIEAEFGDPRSPRYERDKGDRRQAINDWILDPVDGPGVQYAYDSYIITGYEDGYSEANIESHSEFSVLKNVVGKPEDYERWWADDRYLYTHWDYYLEREKLAGRQPETRKEFVRHVTSAAFEITYNEHYNTLRKDDGTADGVARKRFRRLDKDRKFDREGARLGLWEALKAQGRDQKKAFIKGLIPQ